MRSIAVLVMLVAGACPQLSAQHACKDIASFDFANSALTVGGTGIKVPEISGTFNFAAPKERFAFHNGVANVSNDLEARGEAKPDFRISVDRDELLHPKGSGAVRLLVISMEHLTGAGSFQYVVAWECRGHRLHKLLDASGEGLSLRSASDNNIQLKLSLWSEHDARCCPSKRADAAFQWSPKLQAYIGPNVEAIQPEK